MSAYGEESEIEGSRAPLLEHLVELRARLAWSVGALIVACVGCFYFAEPIYRFLLHPFQMAAALMAAQKAGGHHGPFDLVAAITGFKPLPAGAGQVRLVFTAPLEFFFTKMKLAGFGAMALDARTRP